MFDRLDVEIVGTFVTDGERMRASGESQGPLSSARHSSFRQLPLRLRGELVIACPDCCLDQLGHYPVDRHELGFFEHDVMFRAVGDTLALSPPLIVSESQIGEIFDKLARIIKAVA